MRLAPSAVSRAGAIALPLNLARRMLSVERRPPLDAACNQVNGYAPNRRPVPALLTTEHNRNRLTRRIPYLDRPRPFIRVAAGQGADRHPLPLSCASPARRGLQRPLRQAPCGGER